MNNFWALVKINLSQLFVRTSFMDKEASKKKKYTYSIILLIAVLYLVFIFSFSAYQMGVSLSTVHMEKILIVLAFLLSSMMVFLQVFFSSFNFIFKAKDYDLLASFPLKNWVVILSKLTSLLLFCYAIGLIFFAPIAVIYFVFAGFNFIAFLFTIIGFLLLPLFPMFIGLLLAFLVNFATINFRYKNILNLILLIALFVCIMIMSFKMQDFMMSIVTNAQATYSTMLTIYFPSLFISKAIAYNDFLNLFYFVLVSLVPFLLLVFAIAKKYKYLNSYFNKSANVKAIAYQAKSKSAIVSILHKEYGRIFSSPMVLLNSCAGPLILIIFAVSVLTGSMDMFGIIDGFSISFLIIGISNLMASTTTTTFSLEGKYFWLLKTLPVSLSQIIFGKMLAMISLFLIPNVIGVTILSIFFNFSILQVALILILMLSTIVLSAILGIVIDLKHCNLHWSSEIAMVKQSANVLIFMLTGFVLTLAPFLLYSYLLTSVFSTILFCILINVIYIGLICGLVIYLKKNALSTFNAII
ncbi:MAG: hypothetical protein EOM55_00260 [Clostridia bacterium]|nr:hypothetical protein [Clostridia bacterium]